MIISGTWWAPFVNLFAILPTIIISVGIPILIIVVLIMAIKYLSKKNKNNDPH